MKGKVLQISGVNKSNFFILFLGKTQIVTRFIIEFHTHNSFFSQKYSFHPTKKLD